MLISNAMVPRRTGSRQTGSLKIETLMMSADASASTDSIAVALRRNLRRDVTNRTIHARTFAALALIDSRGCIDELCDPASTIGEFLTPVELSSTITQALANFDGDAALRQIAALRLITRYARTLTASVAADTIGIAAGTVLGLVDTSDLDAALATVLARFPTSPALLRAAIKRAQADGRRDDLDRLLTRLGHADRSLATVSLVHRLRVASGDPSSQIAKIALLSSYTIDQLIPYVDLACRTLGVRPEIYVAPFNSWTRDVVDATSGLHAFGPQIAFLAISIDDLIPELSKLLAADRLTGAGHVAVERVETVARAFADRYPGVPLVVHNFHSAFSGPLGILDGRSSESRTQWLARTNAALADRLRALPSCYVLDVAGTVASAGEALVDNPKLRHLAAMRLVPAALAPIADAYVRYIAPLVGLTRKCVVLDLDNTLWGGVVGEDGKDGIRLSATSQGSEFVEFQAFLKSLAARGILLALNSKNNPADALEVIRTHDAMVLRESDFSAIRINWLPKSENMISIANELNIGVDSLVFVDDNPDERERMRQLLPAVLTVDMPKDPSLYRAVLERLPELQTLAITEDDGERVERYRESKRREAAQATSQSVEAYLQSLQISVAIGAATKSTIARVAQLFAKTNQFNATTRRYSVADVERFASDPSYRLLTLQSQDRFGEHGLVAVALVRATANRWTIDSFLMSCRVIGYGIEGALIANIARRARVAGASDVCGEFIPTAKNVPASDLFARHGFTRRADLADVQCWQLDLSKVSPEPAWITVNEHVA